MTARSGAAALQDVHPAHVSSQLQSMRMRSAISVKCGTLDAQKSVACIYLARPEPCNFPPVKGFFADTKLENNRYNYIRWYYIHIAKSPPGWKRAWSRRHKGIREVR